MVENPLARLDGTPRKICAKGYDGYGHVWRDQDSKDINDAIRTLFRNTVLGMFGVKDVQELPEKVRAAMKTGDYDKGKPLTARISARCWGCRNGRSCRGSTKRGVEFHRLLH